MRGIFGFPNGSSIDRVNSIISGGYPSLYCTHDMQGSQKEVKVADVEPGYKSVILFIYTGFGVGLEYW